jgi:hypothetical protein
MAQPQMMISQGKLDLRLVGRVAVAIADSPAGSGDPSDIMQPIKRIGCDERFNFPDVWRPYPLPAAARFS